jgi:hypothetical protein
MTKKPIRGGINIVPPFYHVIPAWEPEHNDAEWAENPQCWCGAMPDKEQPLLIVHNEGRVN